MGLAMYKINEKLRQVTWLIHFQATQTGATLRPSEVKPKLDRFLENRLKSIGQSIDPKWKLRDTGALDYKMRITVAKDDKLKTRKIDSKRHRNGMFLGDNDNGNRQFIRHTKSLNFQIVSRHKVLVDTINKELELFFLTHNFGARQSKGYGSFLLEGTPEDNQDELFENIAKVYPVFLWGDLNFEREVKDVYNLMKSGINNNRDGKRDPKKVLKGFLRTAYPNNRGYGSEKKFMKEQLGVFEETSDPSYKFVRVMLGLAEQYEFPHINKNSYFKVKDGTKEEIQRFQSPVLIKVIKQDEEFKRSKKNTQNRQEKSDREKNLVLFLPQKIPGKLLDREFSFYKRGVGEPLLLKTPKHFDTVDFLIKFQKWIAVSRHPIASNFNKGRAKLFIHEKQVKIK